MSPAWCLQAAELVTEQGGKQQASDGQLVDEYSKKLALIYRKSLSLNGLLEYMVDELFTDEEHN